MPRPRNYVARNPLLRKGGAHERTRSSGRQREHLETRDLVDQWARGEEDAVDSPSAADRKSAKYRPGGD